MRVTLSPDYPRWARAAALTFQMIYQQPVRYEYHQITPPVLLIVGAEDHVVPLGQYAKPEDAARLGDFVELSAAAARDIPRATRVVVPDCGHIPPHNAQISAALGVDWSRPDSMPGLQASLDTCDSDLDPFEGSVKVIGGDGVGDGEPDGDELAS